VWQFGTSAFHAVVFWHKLGDVENKCNSHKFSLFAIFLPKITKIGRNLTKFWQIQICLVFLRHGVHRWSQSFSTAKWDLLLQFTGPLLAAEHFRLLVPMCGTAYHRRLRRHRLWRPSALDSRRSWLLNHILTFGWSDISIVHGRSSVLNTYLGHSKTSWLIDWLNSRPLAYHRKGLGVSEWVSRVYNAQPDTI